MTTCGIAKQEREIRGKWIVIGGKVQADENCRRIEALLANHLRLRGRDASGWDHLYQDPDDDRYWELSYPESELHGGGPPRLLWLSDEVALAKYSVF